MTMSRLIGIERAGSERRKLKWLACLWAEFGEMNLSALGPLGIHAPQMRGFADLVRCCLVFTQSASLPVCIS